jgi:hypothetical protein
MPNRPIVAVAPVASDALAVKDVRGNCRGAGDSAALLGVRRGAPSIPLHANPLLAHEADPHRSITSPVCRAGSVAPGCERLRIIMCQRRLPLDVRGVGLGALEPAGLSPMPRGAASTLRSLGAASILSGANCSEPATNLISRRFMGLSFRAHVPLVLLFLGYELGEICQFF